MRPVNIVIYTCTPLHPTAHGMIQCAWNTITYSLCSGWVFMLSHRIRAAVNSLRHASCWTILRGIYFGSRLAVGLLGHRAYEYNSDTTNNIKFTSSLRLAPEHSPVHTPPSCTSIYIPTLLSILSISKCSKFPHFHLVGVK